MYVLKLQSVYLTACKNCYLFWECLKGRNSFRKERRLIGSYGKNNECFLGINAQYSKSIDSAMYFDNHFVELCSILRPLFSRKEINDYKKYMYFCFKTYYEIYKLSNIWLVHWSRQLIDYDNLELTFTPPIYFLNNNNVHSDVSISRQNQLSHGTRLALRGLIFACRHTLAPSPTHIIKQKAIDLHNLH